MSDERMSKFPALAEWLHKKKAEVSDYEKNRAEVSDYIKKLDRIEWVCKKKAELRDYVKI